MDKTKEKISNSCSGADEVNISGEFPQLIDMDATGDSTVKDATPVEQNKDSENTVDSNTVVIAKECAIIGSDGDITEEEVGKSYKVKGNVKTDAKNATENTEVFKFNVTDTPQEIVARRDAAINEGRKSASNTASMSSGSLNENEAREWQQFLRNVNRDGGNEVNLLNAEVDQDSARIMEPNINSSAVEVANNGGEQDDPEFSSLLDSIYQNVGMALFSNMENNVDTVYDNIVNDDEPAEANAPSENSSDVPELEEDPSPNLDPEALSALAHEVSQEIRRDLNPLHGIDFMEELAFDAYFQRDLDTDSSSSSSVDLDELLGLNGRERNEASNQADNPPPLESPRSPEPEPSRPGGGVAAGRGPFGLFPRNNAVSDERFVQEATELLSKPKPKYTYNYMQEIMRREHGMAFDGRSSIRDGVSGFNIRLYASRQTAERMKLTYTLRKHGGCVNCLNFNRNGTLLCSGSDDLRVVVWNWAEWKPKHTFRSGHTGNIFQTKFLNDEGTDIISSSYDGQVRRSFLPSSGRIQTTGLYKHKGPVHKLVVVPGSTNEIISAGEDGLIRAKDLRTSTSPTDLVRVISTGHRRDRRVRLFSLAHNPYKPEFCACGSDCYIRVFDKRNLNRAVHEMCPEHLRNVAIPQVTCCVYNHDGTEVLASYGDENIYLFNNKVYKTGEFTHRYRGHYNHRTIKGVNFFGPHSEYVISGSDCGNIFIWDKKSEAILNFMHGDSMGVVNCLEAHPTLPVMATSGLEHHIKIWTPRGETPADLSKLEKTVRRNLKRSHEEAGEFDDRLFHYFIRRFLRSPNSYMNGNYMSSTNESSSSEDDYNPDLYIF